MTPKQRQACRGSSQLLSVNVGVPRDVAWQGRTVHTAIWKNPVAGPVTVRRLNVDGDAQGDLAGHGGEQRAVFVYQIGSYDYWSRELSRNDFVMGQFGENFTIDGLADDEVCIGDRYRIGTALFEVSQPRVTCYRVGIRMNEPRMPALLVSQHRPGFYFRVLQEGVVQAGDAIEKVADGEEQMTVATVDGLLYLPQHDPAAMKRAIQIPALSPGWKKSFQDILDSGSNAGNAGLIAPAAPVAWQGFRSVRITQVAHVTSDIISLELESADNAPLAAALPGQFIIVRAPSSDGKPVMRSFSLSSAPSATRYRLGIKLEPHGAASAFFTDSAKAGGELEISAPRGDFVLRDAVRPVVLASAGIGVTPVLAMLYALAAAKSTQQIWWLYGARDGSEHPFAGEVRALLAQLPNVRAYVRYSRPRTEDRAGVDYDAAGRLDVALIQQLGVGRESDFYLCGPPAFLDDFRKGLAAWGATPDCVHSEIFGSEPAMTPGIAAGSQRAPHQPGGAPGTGPLVTFARSDLAVPWASAYRSILELAEACDVPVRWSCRTGVCHTCESGLVSGSVRYDPDPLEAAAPGNLLLCCAQPRNDIVLDI
jgi:ferredoxin-NADP reductase/MOSC domain-containing protein YiiM